MTRTILINPPRSIDPKQRVKYGAAAALTRMAELAFEDLKSIASTIIIEKDNGSYDNQDARMRAINLAWSIVDQADLLRHLIESEGLAIQISEAKAFLDEVAAVKDVRNWMRHLPQRVDGFLSKKNPQPPVLGALSFCAVKSSRIYLADLDEIGGEDVNEYETVVLLSTAFERSHLLEGEPEKYIKFKLPVDHFFLQAHGKNISLDRLVLAMTNFCDALARGVVRFFTQKIDQVKKEGKYVSGMEDPLFPPGQTYVMSAKRDTSAASIDPA
jgi:hypothetical protein